MDTSSSRETLSSRLGFILLSAACAIGLGNVWRFPYITGVYGGALFVLFYLLFLAILGFPCLLMELALGRASQRTLVGAYRKLTPPGSRFSWDKTAYVFFCGNLLLMMFYTTVNGWLLGYTLRYCAWHLEPFSSPAGVAGFFQSMISSPWLSAVLMIVSTAIAVLICCRGLQKGVEKTVKIMMLALLAIMILLAFRALTMSGCTEALKFYLAPNPDFVRGKSGEISWTKIVQMLYAAMGQAFFTLSIGIGSMTVFGSYIGKEHSLVKESLWIILLDTVVALLAGLVIFPICFSFGIHPGSGPGLIFVTLPNMFSQMAGGRWWGLVFFFFMFLAAMTTVVAVFENMIGFLIDEFHMKRSSAALIVGIVVMILSLPCVFGFNIWKGFQPLGAGTNVLDLEDFITSNTLLPLGALYLTLFCFSRYGWGAEGFYHEANEGKGAKFPAWARGYCTYVLPFLILLLFVMGYADIFIH